MANTKRALLTSALAIVACVAMLIGSTFAWFTDTAGTAVNKIQAGNLKIDVEYRTSLNGDWKTLDNATDLFGAEGTLFEPGHTRVVELRITNAGNLALKYKIGMNVVSETAGTNKAGNPYKLSDYLKVATTAIQLYQPDNVISVAMEELIFSKNKALPWTERSFANFELEKDENGHPNELSPDDAVVLGMKVYMPESVGNEANAISSEKAASISFGLNVVATQYTVESDSFGTTYDKDAQYPDVAYVAVSAPTEEDIANGVNPLANALISASAETDISGEAKDKIAADLAAGAFKLTDKEGAVRTAVQGKEITLNGAGADKTIYEVKKANASGEGAADYSFDGAKAVVFKNMTIEFGLNTDYQGFVRAGAVRFENCTIKGMGANWGVGDVVFDNCNFVFPEGGNEYTYNLWTYGGSSFTFNACTFTSDIGKCINVYRQGNNGVVDVNLNNCKFISKAAAANKAAVKINGDHAWHVTINNCTTEGEFPTDNAGLWQIENAVAGNTITVDGTLAYSK